LSLYVVDASVATKWFVPEALSEQAMSLLRLENQFAAPDLLLPEFGNVLWKKARLRELTRQEATATVRAFERVPLAIFPSRPLIESALEIALATGRTVYDSLYLALALALDCPLVTADERCANSLRGTRLAADVLWIGNLESRERS
jgi:predicted nucleic acid-binding protein